MVVNDYLGSGLIDKHIRTESVTNVYSNVLISYNDVMNILDYIDDNEDFPVGISSVDVTDKDYNSSIYFDSNPSQNADVGKYMMTSELRGEVLEYLVVKPGTSDEEIITDWKRGENKLRPDVKDDLEDIETEIRKYIKFRGGIGGVVVAEKLQREMLSLLFTFAYHSYNGHVSGVVYGESGLSGFHIESETVETRLVGVIESNSKSSDDEEKRQEYCLISDGMEISHP